MTSSAGIIEGNQGESSSFLFSAFVESLAAGRFLQLLGGARFCTLRAQHKLDRQDLLDIALFLLWHFHLRLLISERQKQDMWWQTCRKSKKPVAPTPYDE